MWISRERFRYIEERAMMSGALRAVHTILIKQEAAISALSDAVTQIQSDVSTLGTAIADVKTRVAALGSPPDVTAAVDALTAAHNDLAVQATDLGTIATTTP